MQTSKGGTRTLIAEKTLVLIKEAAMESDKFGVWRQVNSNA